MVILVFIYGIVIGSFLNVCIYRIPSGESLMMPPSHCGSCDTRLRWKDLVPILSYLLLKGRCRYCGEKISIRYPAIEFMTGIVLSLIYIKYGISFEFFKYSVLTLFLIVIAMIDFDTTDVYSKVVYSGMAIGAVFAVIGYFVYGQSILTYVAGACIGLVIIGGIYLLTGGIGAGDIEISVLCGMFLGWQLTIVYILVSFIIGGILGISLIVAKIKDKRDYIPLGPSLAIGAYIAMTLGDLYLKTII